MDDIKKLIQLYVDTEETISKVAMIALHEYNEILTRINSPMPDIDKLSFTCIEYIEGIPYFLYEGYVESPRGCWGGESIHQVLPVDFVCDEDFRKDFLEKIFKEGADKKREKELKIKRDTDSVQKKEV